MVNENIKLITENKKPVETVYELKEEYKIPTFEEFMESYENDESLNYADLNSGDIGTQKGYGPAGERRQIGEGSIEASPYRKGVFSMGDCEASGKIGTVKGNLGGEYPEMKGEIGVSVFRIKDWSGDAKFLSTSFGAEVGPNMSGYAFKSKAGLDAISLNSGGVKANAGFRVNTGFTADQDKMDVKLAGFGFTAGKEWGISMPFGGVSVEPEEACVIQ